LSARPDAGASDLPRWIEVRVLVPRGWCELVAETLAIGPCTSVAFGSPSLGTQVPPDGFDFVRTFVPARDDTHELRARVAAELARLGETTGAGELRHLVPEFKPLPAEDYATSWMKSWKAFRVGRLCVLAPWSTSQPRPGDMVMHLEPGGAFGSGRHATTRTCLRIVLERIRGGERVLDAGSGSGILGVAAAMCGAGAVLGFDLDPAAAPHATELAERNAVADRCRFVTAGFEALDGSGPFDVVLANIYADVIQARAVDLRAVLAPGGWFAFSGCPVNHAVATRAAIERAGFVIEEERVRGRWHTFVGRGDPRRSPVPG
jgi:ribosomal protein L11 methyltransferase